MVILIFYYKSVLHYLLPFDMDASCVVCKGTMKNGIQCKLIKKSAWSLMFVSCVEILLFSPRDCFLCTVQRRARMKKCAERRIILVVYSQKPFSRCATVDERKWQHMIYIVIIGGEHYYIACSNCTQ